MTANKHLQRDRVSFEVLSQAVALTRAMAGVGLGIGTFPQAPGPWQESAGVPSSPPGPRSQWPKGTAIRVGLKKVLIWTGGVLPLFHWPEWE